MRFSMTYYGHSSSPQHGHFYGPQTPGRQQPQASTLHAPATDVFQHSLRLLSSLSAIKSPHDIYREPLFRHFFKVAATVSRRGRCYILGLLLSPHHAWRYVTALPIMKCDDTARREYRRRKKTVSFDRPPTCETPFGLRSFPLMPTSLFDI